MVSKSGRQSLRQICLTGFPSLMSDCHAESFEHRGADNKEPGLHHKERKGKKDRKQKRTQREGETH